LSSERAVTTMSGLFDVQPRDMGRTDIGFWDKYIKPRLNKPFSSSTQLQIQENLEEEVIQLFSNALETTFEDGMESDLSRNLYRLLIKDSDRVLDALIGLILYDRFNEEVSSEALRWLGRYNHYSSYDRRRWLLERCLHSYSPRIRDAASLGLASMDDPHAIPFLREAIGREPYPELREDMNQVLNQLENTLTCP
jgi:hypothetical protein